MTSSSITLTKENLGTAVKSVERVESSTGLGINHYLESEEANNIPEINSFQNNTTDLVDPASKIVADP